MGSGGVFSLNKALHVQVLKGWRVAEAVSILGAGEGVGEREGVGEEKGEQGREKLNY